MQPQYAWLRVIQGGACDVRRLRDIVRTELDRASVVRIVGGAPRGDVLEHWSGVGEVLGPQADLSCYGAAGAWMDVGFEPNGRACARPGEVAQPLHNDEASVETLGGAIGLFHCARYTPGGGRTLLLDAGALADAARRRDKALYEALFTIPLRFGRIGGEERSTTVLRQEDGRLRIAWNDFRVLPGQEDAAETLRRRLRLFLQDMVLSGEAASAPFGAGDVIFFRADEVIHGREAPARGATAPVVSKTYFLPASERARSAA